MVRVCKKLKDKDSKGKSIFKGKLLNCVNKEFKHLDVFTCAKFPKLFPLEKPTFHNHLRFRPQIPLLFAKIV